MNRRKCRFCEQPLTCTFVDLGLSPLSNAYLNEEQLQKREPFYPLRAFVCEKCFLVQLEKFESPENIFSDYAYFSSYSESWLAHAARYVEHVSSLLPLNRNSLVIEIASNDGYLLQYFRRKDIPVLGIEPAGNVARVAEEKGIPTRVRFFGTELARELSDQGLFADLVVANNVLAHVPDLNDFVAGICAVLKSDGTATLEFPYLLRLMEKNQFDTIYHEHFSYFSLSTVEKVFQNHGLILYDVEELPTHGGSLRIYAVRENQGVRQVSARIAEFKQWEADAGLDAIDGYLCFGARVVETKKRLVSFLDGAKRQKKRIAGYGAPAKGNTLLNYCGVGSDVIVFTVDLSPHKQGKYLPGTHIPIFHPDKLCEEKPDYVLILPWNLKEEIMEQVAYIRDWGGRFVVPIPQLEVYP